MTATRRRADPQEAAGPARQKRPRRWLLLVHQLPTTPSNLRVRTWRRLQELGALAVKQAVYVLPDSPEAREDFEWLKTEIESAGGEAIVFTADSVDTWSDDELREEFRRVRQEAYAGLARDLEQAIKKAAQGHTRRGGRAPAVRRQLENFRQRYHAIERVDFFNSAGRDRVVTLLDTFGKRVSGGIRRESPREAIDETGREAYQGRLWVTRPRPGVDRMASAWLIKRFIDAEARFAFAEDREGAPAASVPFDMFGVDFSHKGEHCTFETLCAAFGLADRALARVAALVHDLDLKDGRFDSPEAPTIGTVIEGLQAVHSDDDVLLNQGMTLFEALYRAFERTDRQMGLRPVARRRAQARGRVKPRSR
jgi:hypothetical protein